MTEEHWDELEKALASDGAVAQVLSGHYVDAVLYAKTVHDRDDLRAKLAEAEADRDALLMVLPECFACPECGPLVKADEDGWALPEKADGMWHYFQRHADAYHSLCGNWTLELKPFMYQGMDQDTHNCEECRTLPRGN